MTYVLSFRDNERNTGGAVFGGQLQQWLPTGQVRVGYKLVAELVTEPSVTFLIHGYNVDRDCGTPSIAEPRTDAEDAHRRRACGDTLAR